jgi:hypothetical protein
MIIFDNNRNIILPLLVYEQKGTRLGQHQQHAGARRVLTRKTRCLESQRHCAFRAKYFLSTNKSI